MRQTIFIVIFAMFSAAIVSATDTKESYTDESSSGKKWEYLVVSDANNMNFKATGNTALRKETNGAFGREPFVLEQQMDKLGANGWELVAVLGKPNNPTFFFKRRK